MPKATKKRVCAQCKQEKLVAEGFKGAAKRCKTCNRTDEERKCGSCSDSRPSSFAAGKKNCRQCNSQPDTAEHVDVCQGEGCDQPFTTERFEWRGSIWRSTCRTCTNKRPEVPEDAPDRTCSTCGYLKPAKGFHGLKCHDCKLLDDRKRTAQHGQERTIETAPRPEKCSRSDCGALFSPQSFRYSASEGRWKSECVQCYRKQAYHKTWRWKMLASNPDAFRAHNASILCDWRRRHPENVARYYAKAKSDPKQAWERFKRSATNNNKTLELDEEADLQALMCMPCFYCGYLPQAGDPLNSLDRVDNTLRHYCLSNVVTSCFPCNWLKSDGTVAEFEAMVEEEFEPLNDVGEMPRSEIVAVWRNLASHNRNQHIVLPRAQQIAHIHAHMHSGGE